MFQYLSVSDLPHTTLSCTNDNIHNFLRNALFWSCFSLFGVLTIIIHADSSFAIQYNVRCFLWNHIWIFVKKTHYLVSINVLEKFLQHMLCYIYSQKWIDQLYLERLCNDQLIHLDKTQFMLLYLCQYLVNNFILSQITP